MIYLGWKPEDYIDGEVFKKENFYIGSNAHLTQECVYSYTSYIRYALNGDYHLLLDKNITEEDLMLVLESGFYLKDLCYTVG